MIHGPKMFVLANLYNGRFDYSQIVFTKILYKYIYCRLFDIKIQTYKLNYIKIQKY